ncbi:MAG: histidine phosphatase family protein [Gaiellales bacterium]
MARVILLRHGETDWSRDSRWQGHTDVPLNAAGLDQAERLAAPLARQRPTHLVTSDLVRTRQTLAPLAALTGLTIAEDPALREVDVGSWAGLTHAEALERHPEGVARHDAGGVGWTDGETYAQVAERGLAALERHTADLPASALVVVCTHGGLIGAVTGRAIGLDAEGQRRHMGRISHGHAVYLRRRAADAGVIWRMLGYNAPLLGESGPPVEMTIH